MCSYIYNNNYPFIKGNDRLRLYKKISIIIIIWSPSIRKIIDKRHGVLWYKPYHKDKENNRLSPYKKTSIWSLSIRKVMDLSLYKRHGVSWYKVYHKEKKWYIKSFDMN